MQNVKILTLNLHCLVEKHLKKKQRIIAAFIAEHDVDIVFFQEVAQTQTAPTVDYQVRKDNYLVSLQQLLQEDLKVYHRYYEPFKESFHKYDEGLGFLSKYYLTFEQAKRMSRTNSYTDWHTRYVLTYHVTIGRTKLFLANTHFGWTEGEERFEDQFDVAFNTLPSNQIGILAGDFNITPSSEEYNHIMNKGMIDLFDTEEFRNKPTYEDEFDNRRIDFILSNQPIDVVEQQLVFSTKKVSDHVGLYLVFQVK